MGVATKISWCHHTFNPWRGCFKISAGCENCYAEVQSKRNPNVLGHWGRNASRSFASESYWAQPIAWDRAAQEAGERRRVFCASLADVFEDRTDLVPHRFRLFELIRRTPSLDWLLLTKRPETWRKVMDETADHGKWGGKGAWDTMTFTYAWLGGEPPANVWQGVSVENQTTANDRLPKLASIPAAVRFLSIEPLLGHVSLGEASPCTYYCDETVGHVHSLGWLHWVIIGGESGTNARPCHLSWVAALIDECRQGGVAPYVKQLGAFPVGVSAIKGPRRGPQEGEASPISFLDKKGGDPEEWLPQFRLRELPR